MTNSPSGTVLRLALGAALLFAVLVQPNHPGALTWSAIATFPLELPALILLLITCGNTKAAPLIRLIITLVLVPLVILKTADFAMFSALSRNFNPVADLPLIEAGVRLLAGSIGAIPAVLAIAASLAVIALLFAGVWWATGVWAKNVPQGSAIRNAAAVGFFIFAGLSFADVSHAKGLQSRFDPPGTAFTARLGMDRVVLIQATLRDLETFRSAAASDPYANAVELLDLIDRDTIIVFVESYGRTSHDTPFYADLHRATLEAGEAQLAGLGLSMASGFLSSPTAGGQSWLAHSTFANGLWISDQIRYRASLVSGRQSLYHIAARSGFRTRAVMPQITLEWPEAQFLGFDDVFAARDLGYEGLPFNWVTMPDQFTFTALDRLARPLPATERRFIQIATGTSHAPWVPVPSLIDWDEVGDGSVFNEMATAGDPPDVVWRDRERVREQYRLAIDYALKTVLSYAARHSDNPPLMIIIGDHQAAGFIALDERRDVPIHVIGPAHLVERTRAFAPATGLVPPQSTEPIPMDRMRDLILQSFSSALQADGDQQE